MKTAYEVSLFNWNSGIYISLLFATISIVFFIYQLIHKKEIKKLHSSSIIFFMLFSAFGVIIGLHSHYTQLYELKSGNYNIIQGEISDYKRDSKGTQYFSVDDHEFKMLDNASLEQPYHSDNFAKTLLDNQYFVKVYYSGDYILKVEYK